MDVEAYAVVATRLRGMTKYRRLSRGSSNSIRRTSGTVPGVDYEALMKEPGDGVVTLASLLARRTPNSQVPRHRWSNFPIDYVFFLCRSHAQMTGNIDFEDNLLNAILNADPN